jgi:hypothetical protein
MINQNKFNKIYFMHIPKTGGRFFVNYVIDAIKDQLEQNNVNLLNNTLDHANWYSKIDDQTYIVNILRDPASHMISLYTHNVTTRKGSLKTDIDFKLSKDEFYQKIENNSNYQNFQSKAFMRNELDNFGLLSPMINIDNKLLEKRVNRVNLLLNSNNLGKNGIEIQKKIFLDLGIDGIPKVSKPTGIFYNPYSEYFYSKFSNSEKNSIRAYNSIDTKIYNNANYYKI